MDTIKTILYFFLFIGLLGLPVLLVLALQDMGKPIYKNVIIGYAIVGCISMVVGGFYSLTKKDNEKNQ